MEIRKKRLISVILALLGILILAIVAIFFWYKVQLRPVDPTNSNETTFSVQAGATPDQIAKSLLEQGLIRSQLAFSIHTKLNKLSSGLQAGSHQLSPSQSTPEIAKIMQNAATEDLVVQFVPGAMLVDNSSTDQGEKQDIRSALEALGFDRSEIDKAFKADYSKYSQTLFKGRPGGAGIEGYVYGETYHVSPTAAVEQVLARAFDEMLGQVKKYNLEAKYAKHGLNLFEGITLASIVQKEVSCQGKQVCDDQKKVAQVFYKRLKDGMSLGADATFMYAATQDGKAPTVDYDSPYNTRLHPGLTPGPISSPGLGALLAVADPAPGDYLYFVSGDDEKNYFSHTEQEHIQNTKLHCVNKCQLPQ